MPSPRQNPWRDRLERLALLVVVLAFVLLAAFPVWAADGDVPDGADSAIWVGAVVGFFFTCVSGVLLFQVKRASAQGDHRLARLEEQWTRIETRLADTRENYVTRTELAEGLSARDKVVDQRFSRLNDKVDRVNDRCDRTLIRVERVDTKVESVRTEVAELRTASAEHTTKLDQLLEYLAPGGQRV